MFNYIQVKMDDRREHVYIAWSLFYSSKEQWKI
ncbi:hypothetical protein protein [Bacillus cereus G9241]|nr:hypothetical protein protein [Bacillus cereus G9241]